MPPLNPWWRIPEMPQAFPSSTNVILLHGGKIVMLHFPTDTKYMEAVCKNELPKEQGLQHLNWAFHAGLTAEPILAYELMMKIAEVIGEKTNVELMEEQPEP